MGGSRNFRRGWGGGGGPHQSAKKSSDNVGFFLVPSLFYRSQMVNFKESFFKVPEGVQIFPGGGVQIFPGGGGGPFASSL